MSPVWSQTHTTNEWKWPESSTELKNTLVIVIKILDCFFMPIQNEIISSIHLQIEKETHYYYVILTIFPFNLNSIYYFYHIFYFYYFFGNLCVYCKQINTNLYMHRLTYTYQSIQTVCSIAVVLLQFPGINTYYSYLFETIKLL